MGLHLGEHDAEEYRFHEVLGEDHHEESDHEGDWALEVFGEEP